MHGIRHYGEMVLIGLSECDEERTARTEFLRKLWGRIVANPHYLEGHLLLSTAIELYREAMSCFQNGAYLATAILCRATLDACVHLVLSRKRRAESEYEIQTIYARPSWKVLKDHALQDPILRDKIDEIEEIRKKGNFSAHLSQRIDKEIAERVESKSNRRKLKPIDQWVEGNDAGDLLERTCDILVLIIEEAFTRSRL